MKKLIVAFHFQFSSQDGWRCDACRKSGLERKRRCGWLGFGEAPKATPVWARRHVSTCVCPRSYITADSETLLEEYFVRRRLSGMDLARLTARQADAFLVLEEAVAAEMRDAQQNARDLT